jgi:hypothetical protein
MKQILCQVQWITQSSLFVGLTHYVHPHMICEPGVKARTTLYILWNFTEISFWSFIRCIIFISWDAHTEHFHFCCYYQQNILDFVLDHSVARVCVCVCVCNAVFSFAVYITVIKYTVITLFDKQHLLWGNIVTIHHHNKH